MSNRWARLGGVLGIVYCIVGFFLIFLGWNGAASYDDVAAQFPYLISGGVAGLGLIVVGSALIVAQSLRSDRVQLRGAIDDLRAAVDRSAGSATGAGVPLASQPAGGADTVIAGPNSYHRAECQLILGQSETVAMTAAEAIASGRSACRVCAPDGPVPLQVVEGS